MEEEQTQLAAEAENANGGGNGKPPKRKCKLWVKITSITLACIIGIVAILGFTFLGVWNDEIQTVRSMQHLQSRNDDNKEGSVYSMRVKGGFYFDEFLRSGGASNDTQLINYITDHITRGLIDMSISETDIGCSAFTAKSESGDRLFGRNYDFDKTNVCITLCTSPGEGRYRSFSTVDLNYIGIDPNKDVDGLMDKITCLAAPFTPLDGMNEKGLSCGIFMSYQGDVADDPERNTVATDQKDSSKKNITSTTMLRMILDYAATVDEAVALIEKYNLHDSANTSFHYMIADATGRSAVLEWLPVNGTNATDRDGAARELVVTYNDDAVYGDWRGDSEIPYQWVTNFIVHDQDEYYEGDNDAKPGYDRYVHINDRLKATGGIVKDDMAAMTILSEVGRRTWNGGGGVTVHSAVYNLSQKTVLWVANENYSDETAYYYYSFKTNRLTRADIVPGISID